MRPAAPATAILTMGYSLKADEVDNGPLALLGKAGKKKVAS
jgi:hypothetical protein